MVTWEPDCEHDFKLLEDYYTCKRCGLQRTLLQHDYVSVLKEQARINALPKVERLEHDIRVQTKVVQEEVATLAKLVLRKN